MNFDLIAAGGGMACRYLANKAAHSGLRTALSGLS